MRPLPFLFAFAVAMLALPASALAGSAFDYSPALVNGATTTSPHPIFQFVRLGCPAGQDCYSDTPDLVIAKTADVDAGGLLREDLGPVFNAYPNGLPDGNLQPISTLLPGVYYYQMQYTTGDQGPPYASHHVGLGVRYFTMMDEITAVGKPKVTGFYGSIHQASYSFEFLANGPSYVAVTSFQRRDRVKVGRRWRYKWRTVGSHRAVETNVSATEISDTVYGTIRFRKKAFPCHSRSTRYKVRLVSTLVQANAAFGRTPRQVVSGISTVVCK
jgi:hypothetical protein